MKTLHYFTIVIFAIIFVSYNSALALIVPSPFTSGTDKIEYNAGETIKISGTVANEIMKPNQQVVIQVFNPDGKEYTTMTVDLKPQYSYTNGLYNYGYKYEYDLKIGADAVSGYYQIMVYYDKSLESSYTITYNKTHTDYNRYFIYNAFLNNETYPIRYKLSEGNEIHGIGVDTESDTVNLGVTGVTNKLGQLVIELPRKIIDSKYDDNSDKSYTVAVGSLGLMMASSKIKDAQSNAENRTLIINIPSSNGYNVIIVYGSKSVNQNKTIVQNNLQSPLMQFKSGIKADDVKCIKDYMLVQKASDGTPACVKSHTSKILIERGWAKEMTLATIMHVSPTYKVNPMISQATQIIPSCVSQIPHQYAIAGAPGDSLCPFTNFETSGKILDATGFYGIYNYTAWPGTLNFVLEPGHNGTITYLIAMNVIHNSGSILDHQNEINITNDSIFMHDAGMHNHPGVDVLAEPQSERIGNNGSDVINITFAVSKSALPGNYWVTLPPGICRGGEMIILTITDCTK